MVFFLKIRFNMHGGPLILLCLFMASLGQTTPQNCTERCKCLKTNFTVKSCPSRRFNSLSVQLTPQNIVISCFSPSIYKSDIPYFDVSYLTAINDTSPLTLASMIGRCSKAKAGSIRFALNSSIFNSLSAYDNILLKHQLTYLKFENTAGKNVTLLETGFLNYGYNLSTLIINNVQMANLKNYLTNLSHVETLDLAHNGIEIIEKTTWNNLTRLKQLILKDNKISRLETLPNVTYVDLSLNKIETLDKSVFETSRSLVYLNLSGNSFKEIQNDTFHTLRSLETLDLAQNTALSFKEQVFSNLNSLKSLNLSRCHMKQVPARFLLQCKQLLVLNLSGNGIELMDDNAFVNLTNLETLDLSYNRITVLSEQLLQHLDRLKLLFLHFNKITIFDNKIFSGRLNLTTINMASNAVKEVKIQDSCSLLEINLKNNSVENFPWSSLQYLPNLTHLDLSYNLLTDVLMDFNDTISKPIYVEVDVTNNQIQNFTVHKEFQAENKNESTLPWKIMMDMSYNRLKCNCLRYKMYPAPQAEAGTTIMEITSKENVCYNKYPHFNCPMITIKNCPEKCDCYYTRPENAINVNCSSRGMTEFPQITGLRTDRYTPNQTIILLSNNQLNLNGQDNLKKYENVSLLDLSNNQIEDLKWMPWNISFLILDNNKLTSMSLPVVKNLTENTALKYVSLKTNPWKCECSNTPLQTFLIANNNIKVKQNDVFCQDTKELLYYAKICEVEQNILKLALPLSLAILLALISIVSALYYKFSTSIKVYLYSKNWCLWCVAEEEIDKDKTYDVFISYSHKDETFVQRELLPELESGEKPFKVCIHYRDWIPGEFINHQIINSVLDSRRTLVVLSNNFMESVWGKMEFRTAHLQAINEGMARVIVVLYGELDQESLDDEMKTYLKTNTYVEWGDPWFWNKLKYALPHSKARRRYLPQISQESFHLSG